MNVLVLNTGSSSVKYQVIDTTAQRPLLIGAIERIGAGGAILNQTRVSDGQYLHQSAGITDHADAIRAVLELVVHEQGGALPSIEHIEAVGHRVVHGGERFVQATLVTPDVLHGIRTSMALAPLHNPHNLTGIVAAMHRLPQLPHVAVFDTAFHATMPPHAWHYALPHVLYRRHGIRRYGFHGTSHQFVSHRMAELTGQPRERLRTISIHLGNGSSACAIQGGHSVDTSMGFTPLEGLVMGTRSGDVDPAVILHVMAHEEIGIAEATALLNRQSGLLGLSGVTSDMRDLLKEAASGSSRAQLAIDVYTYRVRKYIGCYAAAMGGLDAIGFTGGVGQNSSQIRARCLEGLEFLGVQVEPESNNALTDGAEGLFSSGTVALGVIRAGEELVIALETASLANRLPRTRA
jgi:acetate kinase